MTRTVSDAALLTNVLSRPDPRDFMSLPEIDFDFSSGLDEIKPNRLKIGFLPDMNAGLPVHPEVRAAAQAAAKALSDAGAGVEEMQSFLTPEMLDGMTRFFEARSYNDYMQLPAPRRGKVLPFIAEWCTWRAERFSGRDVMQAYTLVMAMREAAVAACQRFDYVLSPTSPILPYEAESAAPGDDPRNALPHIAFTELERRRAADRSPAYREKIRRRRRAEARAPRGEAEAAAAPLARMTALRRNTANPAPPPPARPGPKGSCGSR